jgi:iron complex outermembrane receptor protein
MKTLGPDRLRGGCAIGAGALSFLIFVTSPVFSQESEESEEEAAELRTLYVTGSRIKKIDVEGASPVYILTTEEMEKEGFSTVYDALTSLSQTTGLIQGESYTNSFTPAAPQLNLRGLGPGRTLYLLNGRRFADYPFAFNGQSNFVNLSQIPISVIDRVEVLSGGASAIYGSDAVAGVINLITKTRVDATEVTARWGTTKDGGGDNALLSIGGGFGGSRWSAVYGVEYFDRDPVFGKDRDQYDERSDFPGLGQFTPPALYYMSDVFGFDWDGDGNVLDDPGEAACGAYSEFEYSFLPGTGYYCGRDSTGDQSLQNARKRWSVYGNVTFQLTNELELFGQALYTDGEIKTYGGRRYWQSPLPFWNTGDTGLNGNAGRALLGPDQPASLSHFARIFTLEETGDQSRNFEEDSLDLAVGLRGGFYDSRWEWEAYAAYSEYSSHHSQFWFKEELINEYFLGTYIDSPFGIPRYDVPDDWYERLFQPMSPEVLDALSGTIDDPGDASNTTLQFNLNGEFGDLPGGAIGVAGVLEWATQDYKMIPDDRVLNTDGKGWWGRGGTSGGGDRDRYAAGIEFYLPLHDTLSVPLALRYDQYEDASDVDGALTYKLGFEWRPWRQFLLRGTYGTSFRAPDMHFLFAGATEGYGSLIDQYLCRRDEPDVPLAECSFIYGFKLTREGNLLLDEEEGESWTFGFVWEVFDNFEIQADLYNIKLEGIVNDLSVSGLLRDEADCRLGVTVGGEPVDQNSEECRRTLARINRNDLLPDAPRDGFISDVTTGPINRSLQEQTGIDATLSWAIQTERAGNWNINATYTHVLDSAIREFEEDPVNTDWRDDPNNFEFQDRFRGSVGWGMGDFYTTVFAYYLGDVPNAAETSRVGEMWTYNLTIQWDITDSIRLSLIGNNVTDEHPEQDETWAAWPGFSRGNYGQFMMGASYAVQLDWRFGY